MRRCALLLALALLSPAHAQDIDPAQAVFVEVIPRRTTWFAGEVVTVDVRVGFDVEFFERSVVQPFQRDLDVPLRLTAPWLETARRLVARVRRPALLAVGDDALAMERSAGDFQRNARSFGLLEQALVLSAAEPRDVDLSVDVHFTYATSFRDDFIEGRVARDARAVHVHVPGPSLRIVALPQDGRPAAFSGGVGRFEIEAHLVSCVPTDAGELAATVRVVLRTGPDTSQERVTQPSIGESPGIHVLGSRREFSIRTNDVHRTAMLWDLAVTDAAVSEVPRVAFDYFDPAEGGRYTQIQAPGLPLPTRARRAERESAPPPETKDEEATSTPLAVGAVLALLLAAMCALLVVVRRRVARDDPDAARQLAAESARVALAAPGADPADVLVAFLAHRLGCAPAAVVSPDLARRLTLQGDDAEAALRTAGLVERLVAARYGGAPPSPLDLDQLSALIR